MKSIKRTLLKIILGTLAAIVLFVLVLFINLIVAGKNESVISKGQPIEKNTNPKPALLIIDIQEVTTGKLSIYPYFRENSEKLIQKINQLADSFKIANLPVIYVRSKITNPLINLLNNSYAKGSEGVKNDRRMKIVSDLEVIKSVKDSFRDTGLDSMLISNKVNGLYIAGLDAAECVNSTVEAAQNRQYKVTIIREAVISKSDAQTDSMMTVFINRGVNVIGIDNLRLNDLPGNFYRRETISN